MKILQIAGSGTVGTLDAGPVSRVIQDLASGLQRQGHQVEVVDKVSAHCRDRCARDIRFHEMDNVPRYPTIIRPLDLVLRARHDLRAAEALVDLNDYDFVHVHEAAQAYVFGSKYPNVIWTVHTMHWSLLPEAELANQHWRLKLVRMLDLMACKKCAQVVCLNRQTQDALGMPNTTVLPNGIDLSQWPLQSKLDARDALGYAEDDFVVAYFGRVAPEKGTDIFVEAAEQVISQGVPIKAEVVGSLSGYFEDHKPISPYGAAVQSRAQNVVLRGFIHHSDPEYQQRMAAADVVVVPSRSEPFGLVTLECLATGANIVGSDSGGTRDMLAGGLGRLFPSGDVAALTDVLIDEYENGNRAQRFINSDHVMGYSWSAVADGYAREMYDLMKTEEEEQDGVRVQ